MQYLKRTKQAHNQVDITREPIIDYLYVTWCTQRIYSALIIFNFSLEVDTSKSVHREIERCKEWHYTNVC